MSKTKFFHAQYRHPDGSYLQVKVTAKNAREAIKKLEKEHGPNWIMPSHEYMTIIEEKGVGRRSIRCQGYDENDARLRLEEEFGKGCVIDKFQYIKD